MNRIIISEAFNNLHEMYSQDRPRSIIKKLNENATRFDNFDDFYEGVWQRFYDLGGEVIDSAVEGSMGTTWVKWSPNSDVYSIDENTALDIAEEVFETTQNMDEVIKKFVNASFPSDKFDEDDNQEDE